MPKKWCLHCRHAPASRPRQLCWCCYAKRRVRALYPVSTSKFARRGFGCGRGKRPLPPFATNAAPGSPEKIAILEQRAAQGVQLWHPDDVVTDRRGALAILRREVLQAQD